MMVFKRKPASGGYGGAGKKFGGKSFGNKSFGDRGGFKSFDRNNGPKPTLFKTVCAVCGDKCEVPFKPNGSKPVLCRNCFRKDEEGGRERSEERGFGGSFAGKRSAADGGGEGGIMTEKRFAELNMKLDRIIRQLEALKGDKE